LNAGVVRRFDEVCVGEKGVILMYLEVGRSSPGAVASNADDGALVNVTAADEAVVRRIVSIRSVFAPTERDHDWCLFVVAGYWKYVPWVDVCYIGIMSASLFIKLQLGVSGKEWFGGGDEEHDRDGSWRGEEG
jgi:hypothetical protein